MQIDRVLPPQERTPGSDRAIMDVESLWLIAIGFTAAVLTGLVVVRGLLLFVQRYSYRIFGWYRIVFGLIVLAALYNAGRF